MILLEVDPNVVKPGWTPLIITILLAAAIVLLMISMRRQMRKVRVPHRDQLDETGVSGRSEAADGGDSAATDDSDPAATARAASVRSESAGPKSD